MNRHRPHPLASALVLVLAAAPLAASTVVGSGTPGSCTEAALDAAIAEANATSGLVTFACGAAPHTLFLTSEKALGQGVAIDGGGRIRLSGNGVTRIFSLSQGSAVSIADIHLVDGFSATGGGCIVVFSSAGDESRLELSNVSLENCRATQFGGAIAAAQAFLTLADCSLGGNFADTGGGGAISLNGGALAAERTLFVANRAFTQGGAVQAWFAQVTIEESLLHFNDSVDDAGAADGGAGVVLRGSAGTFRDSELRDNLAGRNGGGVLLLDGSSASFEDSRFVINRAEKDGGAIYADDSSSLSVLRSTFEDNHGEEDGGAILSRFSLAVHSSTFYENSARLNGYALFAEAGSLELVSSTLVDNHSSATPFSGQLGWLAAAVVEAHNTLFQSPRRPAFACAPAGAAGFTSSVWDDLTCPEGGADSRANTIVPLRPFGFSCGGAATELTRTVPLAPASPSLYAGNCRVGDPAIDQRGMPRPTGGICDVGAAEFYAPCDAPSFLDGFETGNTQRWSSTLP